MPGSHTAAKTSDAHESGNNRDHLGGGDVLAFLRARKR